MPAQKSTANPFLSPAGRQAFEQNKTKPVVEDSGGNLPPGIEGGIAEVRSMSFDGVFKDGVNKGKPFFRAMAVVLEPEEHNGRRVKGKQTSVMEPLCDTETRAGKKTSYAEHMAVVMNYVKMCGLDCSKLSPETIMPAIEAVVATRPLIEFRTWIGNATPEFPNPRTNEVWCRGAGGHQRNGSTGTEGVEDSTPTAPATREDRMRGSVPPAPVQEQAPDEPPTDDVDYDALGALADAGDQEAVDQLNALALDAGYTAEQINGPDFPSWASVAEALKGGGEEGGDDAAWSPDVGDTYPLKRIDPKTKKPAPKATEYEVKEVDTDKEEVVMFNPKNTKAPTFRVKWSELPRD